MGWLWRRTCWRGYVKSGRRFQCLVCVALPCRGMLFFPPATTTLFLSSLMFTSITKHHFYVLQSSWPYSYLLLPSDLQFLWVAGIHRRHMITFQLRLRNAHQPQHHYTTTPNSPAQPSIGMQMPGTRGLAETSRNARLSFLQARSRLGRVLRIVCGIVDPRILPAIPICDCHNLHMSS